VGDFLGKQPELREDVPAAGVQRANVPLDVSDGTEPVVLQLEDPITMVERFGQPDQRHRVDAHHPSLTRGHSRGQ
jgi:hypothetical protein